MDSHLKDYAMKRVLSYKKLWKLLIDKELNKVDLQHITGISSATITKLAKCQTVNTRAIIQICNALNCDVADIMEMTADSSEETKILKKRV